MQTFLYLREYTNPLGIAALRKAVKTDSFVKCLSIKLLYTTLVNTKYIVIIQNKVLASTFYSITDSVKMVLISQHFF